MRPPRLRPGDTVGIFSPSAPVAAFFPHRVERGIARLEALGFRVRVAPHALGQAGFVSASAEDRAADLHALFRDPEVRAIISTIGGDHSCHLLPLLDFDLIRAHPKIVMGYSDMTVLLEAIWSQTGLTTFYGPHVMTELAEYPSMPGYSERAMLKALCDSEPVGALVPSDWWTDELLDWETRADLTRERTHYPTSGWTWLKAGRGIAAGPLVGGCLESMQHLRGTPYWPNLDGAVLFLETSEEHPTPETVDGILMDYENMGVLAHIAALLYGRPQAYTDDERQQVREVLLERTKKYDFPVVADMDFGHTSPMLTLPIGCRATVDGQARRIAIVESGVREG